MNKLILTMIGFVCGMGFTMFTHYTEGDMQRVIHAAYSLGKKECPDDTHCIEHGQVKGLVRLTYNDVKEILE